jgi:hypothetical protein
MDLKLKGNIFGLNYNFDIEARLPRQEIYDLRLRLKWGRESHFNHQTSKIFIWYALKHLPNNSYIIFYFDNSKDHFVQFCKLGGSIVLDLPLWPDNPYYEQEKNLLQFLRDMHFQRIYSKPDSRVFQQDRFDIIRHSKGKKFIRANFGKIYIRAAVGALLIGETIFGIDNPDVSHYESGRLSGIH